MNHRKKHLVMTLVCITLISSIACSQQRRKRPPSYKHAGRNTMAKIADGQHDDAIKDFENYLKKHPDDLESLYGLAVAYTQKQNIEKAFDYTKHALDAGLPLARFLAGPRNLLKPLTDSPQFKKLAQIHPVQLIHGPMLGCVTDKSVKFWVRTANQVPVQILVSETQKMQSPLKSAIVKTDKDRDFTAVVSIEGLKPDTKYYYELLLNNQKQSKQRSFRTFTSAGTKKKFKVAFGGGAGYTPQHERMWSTIASQNPSALVLLGDNVYIDHPEKTVVQEYCYYRRRSRPEYRSLTASVPVYAIWDDHDFGDNDSIGSPDVYTPWWKIRVWLTFRNNWNNPYYGGGKNRPGCWFDFSIGDVDFFMLDGRYYRTDPQKENPTMLGPVQKKWLLEKLKASKATFKVLASPVPFSFGTKPSIQRTRRGMVHGGLDTWEGFKAEREEIFSFIEKNEIDGVILIAADRHRSDARKNERPNGYPLYEFESSKLTNIHTHDLVPSALFGYNEKCSFGLLTFDTTIPDAEVTFQIVNIDNDTIHTLILRKSQLTHKTEINK